MAQPIAFLAMLKYVGGRISCFFLAGFAALFAIDAHAQSYKISQGTDGANLTPYSRIYYDKGHTLKYDDIHAGKADNLFKPVEGDSVRAGYTQDAVWLRITLENDSPEPFEGYLEYPTPWANYIDFYFSSGKENFKKEYGAEVPFGQRDVNSAMYFIPVKIAPKETASLTLRVVGNSTIVFAPYLRDLKSGQNQNFYYTLFSGLLIAGILVMALYNLFVYFSLRDVNYLLYVFYLVSIFFFCGVVYGFNYQLLWPTSPVFNIRSGNIFIGFAIIMAIYMTRGLLKTGETLPKLDKVMRVLTALTLLGFATVVLPGLRTYASSYFSLIGGWTIIVTILSVVICWKRGVPGSGYLLLAWSFSSVGGGVLDLVVRGLINFNHSIYYFYGFCVIADMLLLSFALADRINSIRLEKEAAEKNLFENEVLLVESMKKAYAEMEAKVEERTIELAKSRETAVAATALKDKFISIISHDLRGPLGAIRALMQFSQKPEATADELRRHTKVALNSSESLLEMLDKLLDISRLQTGQIVPKKTGFGLWGEADMALEKLLPVAGIKGLAIHNNISRDAVLFADKELVGAVLLNLLSNAIKFTPQGGTITVFQTSPGVFAVRDTGSGINPKLLPDIFRHDVKTTSVGTEGETGTGLGLPFCHDILRSHGGSLRVDTTPTGSTFIAEFPANHQ